MTSPLLPKPSTTQLTDYPGLKVTKEVSQGVGENVGQLHDHTFYTKLVNLTGTKKNRRSLPVGVCANNEQDGQKSLKLWPRSHSLDNLQQEGNELQCINENKVFSLDKTGSTSVFEEGTGDVHDKIPYNMNTVAHDRAVERIEIARTYHIQSHDKDCTAQNTNDFSRVSTDKPMVTSVEPRVPAKNPSQPPPVPAKKCRERFANGLSHPPLSLTISNTEESSLPVIKSGLLGPNESSILPAQECVSPTTSRLSWFPNSPDTPNVPQHAVKLGPVSARKMAVARGMDQELLIENKLQDEEIDLTEEPYSDKVNKTAVIYPFVEANIHFVLIMIILCKCGKISATPTVTKKLVICKKVPQCAKKCKYSYKIYCE